MKKNKIVMSVISGLLVAAVAVGGTLAYLSDTSNQVTNTFNVGTGYIDDDVHQGLWLDEVDITKDDGSRTEKGNDYLDLLPGDEVEKDPTFHITKGSVESYVIARVTGVQDAMAAGYIFKDADGEVGFNDVWVKVADLNGSTVDPTFGGADGYYIYCGEDGAPITVDASKAEADVNLVPMFNTVELNGDITDLAAVAEQTVKVQGVAVQADNNTAEGALEVALGVKWEG